MADEQIEVHPVQTRWARSYRGYVPKVVTMRAYEVYTALFGKQEALVTGECRGGFGVNELIGFLYASGFPRAEWRARFDEAITGMKDV